MLTRVAALIVSAAGLCLAQFANQEISGFVTDPSDAAVPNARVFARHLATGRTQATTSDTRGYYVFLDVPIGDYAVVVEAPGFKRTIQIGVKVSVSAKITVPIRLDVGDVKESVSVSANALQVETSGGEMGRLITGEQAANLPLNGRSFAQLLALVPGVATLNRSPLELVGAYNSNNSMQSVNGLRRSTASWNVDGVDNKDNGGNGNVFVRVNLDAIAEFKILTSSYNAENGQNAGAIVNLAVKSGTRNFHGSPYGFLRARTGNGGWNLGGPVYIPHRFNAAREKLFFFASEDFLRMETYTWVPTSVPSLAQRTGDFSASPGAVLDPLSGAPFPGNRIPSSRIDRNTSRLVNNAPSPNLTGDLNEYDRNFETPTDDHQYIQKLDYRIDDRHQLALLYLRDGFYQLQNQTSLNLSDRHITGTIGSVKWTWARDARTVNTFQTSESGNRIIHTNFRQNSIYSAETSRLAAGVDNPMLYGNAAEIPDISIQGYTMPPVSARATNYAEGLLQWKDDFSRVAGPHIVKFGVLAMRSRKNQSNITATNGEFSFRSGHALSSGNALADALLGNFNTYTEASGHGEGWFRFTQVEFYAQDNWKISRRFSLDIGVRFHYMQPQYSALGNTVVFDAAFYDPANAVRVLPNGRIVAGSGNPLNGLVLGGAAFPTEALARYPGWNTPAVDALFHGLPKEVQSARIPVAPRIGFAWDVTGTQRTVLRGAWGLFFERIQGNVYFGSINNAPFIQRTTLYSGNAENPTGGAPASAFPQDVTSYPADGAIPTAEQYNLGLQQSIGRAMLLDVSYVGSSAWHLYRGILPNQLPAGAMLRAPTGAANGLRPYAGLGGISQYATSANSNYNSLQAELRRQMPNGGFLSAAYTWSRNLTDATDYNSNPQDSYHFKNDRGLSGYHRAHVFSASYVYPLPFWRKGARWYRKWFGNWQLSGMALLQTGLPFDLTATGDPAAIASTGGNQRPDVVGDWTLGGRTATAWFNTKAFGTPAPGSFGSVGRNVLTGPAMLNWDAALEKGFRVTERLGASFRWELFNALDHRNYWGVEGDMTSPRFGQVTTVTDPRAMQAMMRFSF
jgi:hypothetical protein